jgi:hypothetical protein
MVDDWFKSRDAAILTLVAISLCLIAYWTIAR